MRGLVFFVMTLSLALAMDMSDLKEGLSELSMIILDYNKLFFADCL